MPHRVYPPGYHCDPKQPLPFICLASQKNYLSLYLGCVYGPDREKPFREAWAKTGKKLDMGKSCIRFRRAEDLALDVIGDAVRRLPAWKYIAQVEAARPAPRQSPPKKRAAKQSTPKKGASQNKPAKAAKAAKSPRKRSGGAKET